MADWTDADQRQLDELEAQERQLSAQAEGDPVADAHVAAVSKPVRPEDRASSGFSTVRMLIGAGRDIIEEPLRFIEKTGDDLEQRFPLPAVRLGKNASNGIADIVTGEEAKKFTREQDQLPHLGQLEGSDNANPWEKMGRSVISLLVPYAGWAKKLGVAKAGLSVVNRVGRAAAAGVAADFVNQAPETNNMASVIKDTFGIDNPTLDWLSFSEDDSEIIARLKAAATNLPVGIAADGLFEAGAKMIRAYGRIRGEAEEARGIVEALEHDYGIKPVEEPRVSSVDAEAGGAPAPRPSEDPFNSALHVGIQAEKPQTWEDILSFLERKVDDPNLPQHEMDELSKIANGDPENALARLGIEPAKLNWSEFDNPEGIKNLHQSLIDIYEKVGQRLGRTGENVTEGAIHTAARSFASDAEVLKTLFGQTKNLPEILMGARMFVGAHAHTLLGSAEDALDALTKDAPGSEGAWQQFLTAFHRHALYLGTVRGAGSEIGRALKSLQFLARRDLPTAKGLAADLAKKVPTEGKVDAVEQAAKDASAVNAITDPAERIMVLSKLLEKGDDVGQLAQFVRGKSGSALQRADGIARETISNLFSAGTAAYNIKSGLTMMTFRGLGRWMAAAARLPLALAGGEQARLARIAAMDAWAYTDGVLGAVNEAVKNTLMILEREGASELYINADNLGLKGLAKKAATWNAKATRATVGLGKNFERVDIDATPRRFAFNPADRRALEEIVDSENLPQMVIRGLTFLTRAAGASVNAVGTLTRLGTILFINAPDQFIGSMAAKAGAQSAAIREAAARAAELGIEGKELTKYLRARVASLATDVDGWSDQGFQDGFREVTHAAGEHEAREVLFQDPIEFNGLRRLSQAISKTKFASIPIPFPHTPMRILERTAIDYTPLGLLKSRFRQAVLHGSPQQREQALSQMGLGIFAMYLASQLVEDRTVVGNDGTFTSTARMNRESYTLRIGGDVYEFSRDDPMGTLLGMAADYQTYMNHRDPNDPEAESKGQAMWEAGAWAAAANMLSKAWLESLKNLTDLAGAFTEGEFVSGLHRYARNTVARRIVPAAGLQKAAQMTFDPWERQATTFQEEMLKYTLGASKLPVKRNWLGEEEPHNLGERFIGLTWKPESTDPLIRELDRLSIQTRLPDKDIKGVPLTSDQYSRLLELRGNGVKGDFGTMKEALDALIHHPGYQSLTDPARVDQIKRLTDGYTKDAKDALMSEDPELHARVIRKAAYDQSRTASMSPDNLKAQNEALGRELGLIDDQ